MSNDEVMLTPEGKLMLEQELEELKTVKRKELAARIKMAISYGDLKENSEYHSAKEDQAFMETRILTIEGMLRKARIVQSKSDNKIQVGTTVVLLDVEMNENVEYKVVGAAEADVLANKISYESPMGVALIGKTSGDKVVVNAPMGDIEYKVLEIK
ncbi:transcription elongation factor GreA [Cohnella fermenti]|uniref:Transcription elongation factor GreA n=1 Tax=Cohnella fermenti TaxID=2565925 RepID=A0A4S4C1U6_9BACL|nr:transcription elongation factor GreA [Cohnella fermenti]THF79529.1 transcription elongation factor GreA [Cohnella fermenti]